MMPAEAGRRVTGGPKAGRPGWARLLWGVPAALAVAIYLPFVRGWYLGDDFSWLFSARAWILAPSLVLQPGVDGYFRPVPRALAALELILHGDAPALFIAGGIALHAANATLLALVAWLLSGRRAVGWAAGVCFALITHYWSAVPWIAGRTEMCAAFFGLLSVASLIRWRRTGAPAWYAAALVGFALAALSKETAVYFWPVLIAVDVFLGRRPGWWRAHVAFALLMLAIALPERVLHAQRLATWRGSVLDAPVWAPRNLLYLMLAAGSPLHRSLPHSRAVDDSVLSLLGLVVLAAAAAGAPRRWMWLGLAWLALAAAPFSFMKPQYAMSWYGYGPALAAALLAGGAIVRVMDTRRPWRVAAALALVGAYAATSLWQLGPSRQAWIARSKVLEQAARAAPLDARTVDLVNLPIGGLGYERQAYLAYIYRGRPIPAFRVIEDPGRRPGIVAAGDTP